MVDSTTRMLDKWSTLINSGRPEIDIEREITATAGEIIAKTSCGVSYESGENVFHKLRELQMTLFKTNRFVGVPYSKFLCPKKALEAKRLGKEIDGLFLSIITDRKKSIEENPEASHDLLGLLLQGSHADGRKGKMLTPRELVDECKTFFFGGHETTALAITWTLLLLAVNQDWQDTLRAEIREVFGDKEIDVTRLAGLKKVIYIISQ
jgi:cytochrome P450